MSELIIAIATIISTALLAMLGYLFKENTNLQTKLSKVETKLETIQSILMLKDFERTYMELKAQLEKMTSMYQELLVEQSNLEQEIQCIQQSIQSQKTAAAELTQLFHSLQSAAEAYKKSSHDLSTSTRQMQDTLASLQHRCVLLEKKMSDEGWETWRQSIAGIQERTSHIASINTALKEGWLKIADHWLTIYNRHNKSALEFWCEKYGSIELYDEEGHRLIRLGDSHAAYVELCNADGKSLVRAGMAFSENKPQNHGMVTIYDGETGEPVQRMTKPIPNKT